MFQIMILYASPPAGFELVQAPASLRCAHCPWEQKPTRNITDRKPEIVDLGLPRNGWLTIRN